MKLGLKPRICDYMYICIVRVEIDRVEGKSTSGEETPAMVRLTEKVVIPVEDHPNVRGCNYLLIFVSCSMVCVQFNYVGRLLGPRGLTLKRMQSETGCKMTILGRGSMRDKEQVCVCGT